MIAEQGLLDILMQPEIPAPVKPARVPDRFFYRCADCLSVMAIDAELRWILRPDAEQPYPAANVYMLGKCGACGGYLEFMGKVERNRLVRTEERSPCDARCTHARGPSCDCKCGGMNHGSGLWVTVTIDAGGIPVANVAPFAMSQARAYRELYAAVKEAINERYGRYLDGTRLTRMLHAAAELRTHAARNKKLNAILGEVSK